MASGPSDDGPTGAGSDDDARSDAEPDVPEAATAADVRPTREALDRLVTTRRAAIATVVAAALAAAGWYTTRPVTGHAPDTVADRFYESLIEGDLESANERLHPESPWRPVEEAHAAAVADAGLFVAETAVHDVRGDDSRAVVELVLRAPGADVDGSRSRRIFASLRTADRAWMLWDPGLHDVLDWLAE